MSDYFIINKKKFFIIILTLEISLLGLIGMNHIGIIIPLVREIISILYLTFVPGILILHFIKIEKISIIEMIMYSLGLSISFLMFFGLLINIFLPIIGFSKPISEIPLITFISIFVLSLNYIIYKHENYSLNVVYSDQYKYFHTNTSLFFYFFPLIAIFGTYLVNYEKRAFLLYILIFLLSLVPLFFSIFKNNKNFYLIIYLLALSLLLHSSLITNHLIGGDIHYEYYYANLVKEDSLWNSTYQNPLNAMLSIVLLAPIYSIVSTIELVWIFKIVYPFLFAFVPLGLYHIFKKHTNELNAFYASFFFIIIFPFYTEMIQLARQQIAELFLVLLLIILTDLQLETNYKRILSIIFTFSLIVSHYGLTYLYILVMIIVFIILYIKNYINTFCSNEQKVISNTYILLLIVLALTWYFYVSISSSFFSVVHIGNHIAKSIAESIFSNSSDQGSAQGLTMILYIFSPLHQITKYLYLISQIFILIGFISLFKKKPLIKFSNEEFLAISFAFLLMDILGIILPNFASALNTTRLFQISTITLALFFPVGAIFFIEMINKINVCKFINKNIFISIYLMIFLLFTSGFVYELFGDESASYSLNQTFDFPRYNNQEVISAKWIMNRVDEANIFADPFGVMLLKEFITTNKMGMTAPYFVYLREWNIKNGKIMSYTKIGTLSFQQYSDLNKFIGKMNKIYSNGASEIYFNN